MKNFIACVIIASVITQISCFSRLGMEKTEGLEIHTKNNYANGDKDSEQKYAANNSSSSMGNSSALCPPWSYFCHRDKACKCPREGYNILKCNSSLALYVLSCNCVTYNSQQNWIEFGHCEFTCVQFHKKKGLHQHLIYNVLPHNISRWNHYMCGRDKRSGSLCGKCAKNYYPRAYSFDSSCIKCEGGKSNWWKFLLLAFLPLTIFYVVILLFEVNIHSTQLLGFVLFSQYFSLPPFGRLVYLYALKKTHVLAVLKLLGLFYGIWNLDFFRIYNPGICLKIGTLATLSLDLIIAVFPLLLMAFTFALINLYKRNFKVMVILWMPFRSFFHLFKSNWDIQTSTVDAFATFYFLVSNKVTLVCFDLLNPVFIYQYALHSEHINSSLRLYYDATIPYFSSAHLPYAILAIIALTVLVNIPILILLLYSFRFFRKCISTMPNRWQIYLHTFVDTFQGCYKDGTESNSRDCRWFPGMILLVRVMVALIFSFYKNSVFLPQAAMVFVMAAIITITIEPFKQRFSLYSNTLVVFLLFIAGAFTSISGHDIAGIKHFYVEKMIAYLEVVFGVLPLLTISIYIGYWVITLRGSGVNRKNYNELL